MEDLNAALAALQADAQRRIDDVSRGLVAATHHLGVPAEVMQELERLAQQAQVCGCCGRA